MSALAERLAAFPPESIAWLAAIAFLASLSRGFSGFGGALIFVPLASALVGPRTAVPLLLVIDAFGTVGHVPRAWREARRGEVGFLLIGALVAVPAGAVLLAQVDPIAVRWCVAGMSLAMLALLASGWRYQGTPQPALSIAVGTVAGFLNGLAQVGGPLAVAYWLGGKNSGSTVRANLILFFAVTTVITMASYLAGGLLTAPVLALAAVAVLPYIAGFYVGTHLFGLASEATFRRVCYALILASAVLSIPALDGVLR